MPYTSHPAPDACCPVPSIAYKDNLNIKKCVRFMEFENSLHPVINV
jgi:hypothetical protein